MSRIIKQVQIKTMPVVINSLCMEVNEEIAREESPTAKPLDHIALAQQEAAACIAKAMKEMEAQSVTIYKESQETGFAAGYADGNMQGYTEGYAAGEESAKELAQTTVQSAAEEASRILAAANRQAQQTIVAAERQIIDIALAVAEKILAYEIESNSQTVVSVVKAAMDKVRNQEQLTIRVHPSDFASVIAAKSEFDTILQCEQSIEFAADQTVSRGGCVIDSAFGSADARIETQMLTLQSTIRSLLS